MTWQEKVRQYLEKEQFDGLYYPGECVCLKKDLYPCGEYDSDCYPWVKEPCNKPHNDRNILEIMEQEGLWP